MNPLYVPIGFLIGLAVAAPVGAVNLICINRTFRYGPWQGFAVGIAAAMGDALFAAMAAAGISQIASVISVERDVLRLTGGIIVLGFAWFVWRSAPRLEAHPKGEATGLVRQSLAVFTLTIFNPATLTAFVAIFAGSSFKDVGTSDPSAIANALALITGVFAGSLAWWLVLCHGAARLKGRISDQTLVFINHGTAALLALFGLAALIAGIHH